MRISYDRTTTTIEREWLARIIAGTREDRIPADQALLDEAIREGSVPFELRLLNGMNPPVPQVTVLIHEITKDRRAGCSPTESA
jgi:hypothetical protein